MDNEQIIKELIELKVVVKNHTEKIETIDKKTDEIASLNTTVALLNASIQDLKEVTSNMNKKMGAYESNLNNESAKKWSHLVNTIISALAGGIVGYFLMKMGLK